MFRARTVYAMLRHANRARTVFAILAYADCILPSCEFLPCDPLFHLIASSYLVIFPAQEPGCLSAVIIVADYLIPSGAMLFTNFSKHEALIIITIKNIVIIALFLAIASALTAAAAALPIMVFIL